MQHDDENIPQHPALIARQERQNEQQRARDAAVEAKHQLPPAAAPTPNDRPEITEDGKVALTPEMFKKLLAAAQQGAAANLELERLRAQQANQTFVAQTGLQASSSDERDDARDDERAEPIYDTLETADEPRTRIAPIVAQQLDADLDAIFNAATSVQAAFKPSVLRVERPNHPYGPVQPTTAAQPAEGTSNKAWVSNLTIEEPPPDRVYERTTPQDKPRRTSEEPLPDGDSPENERDEPRKRKTTRQSDRPLMGQSYESFFEGRKQTERESIERNERWHAGRGTLSPMAQDLQLQSLVAESPVTTPDKKGGKRGERDSKLNPLLAPHANVQTDLWLSSPVRYKEMYEAALDALRLNGPWRKSFDTVFTPTVVHVMCSVLESGASRSAAGALAGIMPRQLDYMRQQAQKGAEPYQTVDDLCRIAEGRIELRISTNWAKSGMLDWQAGQAFLAKRFSEQWGDKKILELSAVQLKNLSVDQLAEIVGEEIAQEILDVEPEAEEEDDFDFDTTPIDEHGNSITMPRDDDAPDPSAAAFDDPDPNYTTPIEWGE